MLKLQPEFWRSSATATEVLTGMPYPTVPSWTSSRAHLNYHDRLGLETTSVYPGCLNCPCLMVWHLR